MDEMRASGPPNAVSATAAAGAVPKARADVPAVRGGGAGAVVWQTHR